MKLSSGKTWISEKYKNILYLYDYSGWNNSEEEFNYRLLTETEFLNKVIKSNYVWNIDKL